MFAGSIVIAVILCAAMFHCADKVLILMSVSGVLAIGATAIFLATQDNALNGFSVFFFLFCFLYGSFVCYLREYLEKAAILTKTIAVFIL